MSDFFIMVLITVFLPLFAGFYTGVATPLLLPVYPAILAATAYRNPLKIALSFALSYTFFSLIFTLIIFKLYIPAEAVRYFAILCTALFGFGLVFLTRVHPVLFGSLIGFVWATYMGPFMPQLDYYAPTSIDLQLTALTLFFGLGCGLFVFLLIYLVQKLLDYFDISPSKLTLYLGGLMVLIAISILVGWFTPSPRDEFVHPEPAKSLPELFNLPKPPP